MENYLDIIVNSYTGYFWYLLGEITHLHSKNYILWLLVLSGFFFSLEIFRPWRVDQPRFRKDFWLDFFYMFFNFFLFSLIVFNAMFDVFIAMFNDFLSIFGIMNLVAIKINSLPFWGQMGILFLVGDFLQWNIHRLLHRVPFLWEFHKLHHSVEEMGFAAHLRYHWMENVVYKTLQYVPLSMIGYGIDDLFIMYVFQLAVGHYNHSNISVNGRITGSILGGLIGLAILSSYPNLTILVHVEIMAASIILSALILGPFMKIIFNSPEMHIWHHAHDLPETHRYGMNFGITLAIWDYIFKTNYMPESGRNIKLGFEGIDQYPKTFWKQFIYGWTKKRK